MGLGTAFTIGLMGDLVRAIRSGRLQQETMLSLAPPYLNRVGCPSRVRSAKSWQIAANEPPAPRTPHQTSPTRTQATVWPLRLPNLVE
jgi:hypothetical protein